MSMVVLVGIVVLMLLLDHKENAQTTSVIPDSIAVVKADSGMEIPVMQKETNTLPPPVKATQTKEELSSDKDLVSMSEATKSVVYELFKINPEKGAILYTQSGERLLVPVFAFADKNGTITKKEVTLRYRTLSSLEEAGLKPDMVVKPSLLFEIISEEVATRTPLQLVQPIEMEATTVLQTETGKVYNYSSQKKNWETSGNEKIAYRFKVQANESEFPELKTLQDLAWELPETAGKPADFGYIFNRPWKNFSFKTQDKKELAIKNTNSSFKSVPDIIPMLGDQKADKKLREAFYLLYNYAAGKSTDTESQKQAVALIDSWKNSVEGKQYTEWLKNKAAENQFYTDKKTSKILIKSFGYTCLTYTSPKTGSLKTGKRILSLEKYPEKTQQFSNELLEKEPSLLR